MVQPTHIVLQTVQELENRELSIEQAMEKYDVKRLTINSWLKKHSTQITFTPPQRVDKTEKRNAVRAIKASVRTRKETAQSIVSTTQQLFNGFVSILVR